MKAINMSGRRFENLLAIRPSGNIAASRDKKWIFKCDCGVEFEANGYYARCGKIKCCPSCSKENTRKASTIHGMSESSEFGIWTDIQTRCYNKNSSSYFNYGGRGIRVCDEWLISFSAFLSDMGRRPSRKHSIERLDVNGDYGPSNCKWATDKEQANNKRTSLKATINGVTKNIIEWCEEKEFPYSCAYQRLKKGITGEALFLPVNLYNRK